MTVRHKLSLALASSACLVATIGSTAAPAPVLTGPAAFGDYKTDSPGVVRHLRPGDLPAPGNAERAVGFPQVVARPADAQLHTLPGFAVTEYGSGFNGPRLLAVAPNGDVFVAEQNAGRVKVLRPGANGATPTVETFAENIRGVFGIAFYPAASPQWVYVAENNTIKRFAYRTGDMKASGAPETIVASLSANAGGHVTRDIAFTQDGSRMLVSIGSQGNLPQGQEPTRTPEELAAFEKANGVGAAWGGDTGRAGVISFTPTGQDRKPFANGIRNCVALERNPINNDFYCAVNERDGMGDRLVPDYFTRVREGAFYGWPWYFIGANVEPRIASPRPDLSTKVTVPDVLFQPHSAAVGSAFYPANITGRGAFPAQYRGDAFVTLHGSWNHSSRVGYKVVRVRMNNGVPTGEYEDFVTGFVTTSGTVWGRPSGIAVMNDGSLLFTDPEGNKLWRVTYSGQ
jgi:glucose/arabinose dehydrogenase